MKNYQNFKKYFLMLSESWKDTGFSNIDLHYIKSRKTYYKKIGVVNEDKIKQLEHRKIKEMNDRVSLSLSLVERYGSVYEIEDDVMRYISMNKIPPKNIISKLKLPFKSIFIETAITKRDFDIGVNTINGILILQSSLVSSAEDVIKDLKYKNLGRIFILYYFCQDKGHFWIDEFKLTVDDLKEEVKIHYDDLKTYRFLKRFLMNFILFINDPEVELVVHKRSEKNIRRRIRSGKIPLPSSRKVRLIGKLKKYMGGIRSNLSQGKFQFRFWVSGHYRTLRSDKYTYMRNKVIRIEPYIKGSGMLLTRTYELKFEKKDDRRPDELKFEDIK